MLSICWIWKMFALHDNKWVFWKAQEQIKGDFSLHNSVILEKFNLFQSPPYSHPWKYTLWSQVVGFPSLGGQAQVPSLVFIWYIGNSHHWLAKLFELDSSPSFQPVNFHQFFSSCSISTEDRSATTTLYNQISIWGFSFLFLPDNSILYEGFFWSPPPQVGLQRKRLVSSFL